MLQDGDHRRGLGHIAAGSSAALRTGTGARPAKYTRRISDAQSMRAKGGGTTPVPRLLRGRASLPAPDGSDAAPSLDGSRSAAALVPFAPFRFLAFRAGARVPSAPARASPGTTAERQGEFGASTPANRRSGYRGGGTNADIRAKKCTGVITRWVAPFRRGLRSWYATRPSASTESRSRLKHGRAPYRHKRDQRLAISGAHRRARLPR